MTDPAGRKPQSAPLAPPGPRTKARAAEAAERNAKRPIRPRVVVEMKADAVRVGPPHSDGAAWQSMLLDAFGTTSDDFVTGELGRIANALRPAADPDPKKTSGDLNFALAAIAGTQPENEIEAMLAGQMAVVHALGMEMLGRTGRAQTIEQLHAFGSLANKLLRTYTMQVEALAKLKRGGEQTVRVEHVHVYPGAQAIVGAISAQRAEGGVGDERGNQADGTIDARAIAFAPCTAMFGPDARRDALPEGGGDGQETLPDAWRGKRQRRTSR